MHTNRPIVAVFAASLLVVPPVAVNAAGPVGASGQGGCLSRPKQVSRRLITEPGVYENYLVDAEGASGNIVKIAADHVTLRHCEIRNGSGNGVGVFAPNVTIENCRIHHMLAGTFKDQNDAHGITGRWGNVVIRNCDISYVSGDCIQFDPDRRLPGAVLIENCTLWTGPLAADAAGFKAGERPGENGVDTKTPPGDPRCRLTIRNCYVHGFNQPAQIMNAAALNLKENVDAEVVRCVFNDNELAFRVRGPGDRGGAHVRIDECAIYNTRGGVRAENRIEQLKITRLAFGRGVGERLRFVPAGPGPGYENRAEQVAPSLDSLLKTGFLSP